MALIQSIELDDEDAEWDCLEDLIEERADISIKHAFDGFGIDYDEALLLLLANKELTKQQEEEKLILIAAISNIVDFSAAAEYQVAQRIPGLAGIYDPELSDFEEGGNIDKYLEDLNGKYNKRFFSVENSDIKYSMEVAKELAKLTDDTVLTYMTQGDERVRPWHLQYEGFSAPKASFPAWLIPPIEYQCRCYLVESAANVSGNIKAEWAGSGIPQIPEWFNMAFKESVSKGGRIFSEEHPYFEIKKKHYSRLNAISERIKKKYLG